MNVSVSFANRAILHPAIFLWCSLMCGWVSRVQAQPQTASLTLTECHQKAMSYSPIQQQKMLLETNARLKDENLKTGYFPRFGLNGQLAWQSDVITFPSFPGSEFPEIPQTQYNVNLSINQPIYEGGQIRQARALNKMDKEVRTQEVDVNLNQIKEAINQLYFAILIAQKNEEVLTTTIKELEEKKTVIEAGVKYGTLLRSNLDGFQKQILTLEQQRAQVQANKAAFTDMLGEWIGGENVSAGRLATPVDIPRIVPQQGFQRPEYKLFDLQQQQLSLTKEGVDKRTLPQISAFATGGVGQPNPYNFLETGTEPFMQVGVRLKWQPWNWNQVKREEEQLTVQQQMINTRREQFDQTLRITLAKDRNQLESLENLIQKDQEIIDLQESIVKQSASQLENGVITTTDYLTEVNAQTQARINLEIHKIQRVQARVNILTKSGAL